MALILEVLRGDDRTVRDRVRVGPAPLSIGRGLDNDVILEDAYVDARHARVRTDDEGNVVLEDLGSVNGLLVLRPVAPGPAARTTTVIAAGGTEVRVGRTTLRFRDPAETVPAALVDTTAAATHAAGRFPPFGAGVRIALPILAATVAGTLSWLGTSERSSMSEDVLPVLLVFGSFAAIWSGIWAIAARIVVGRSSYGSHVSIVSAATLAVLLAFQFEEWMVFLHPSGWIWPGVAGLVMVVTAGVAIALHLRLASTMTHARCWRIGASVSGVIVAFGMLATVVERDGFSDVPDFPGVLKPVSMRWPAPASIEDFLAAAETSRREADELAERTPRVAPAPEADAERPAPEGAGEAPEL